MKIIEERQFDYIENKILRIYLKGIKIIFVSTEAFTGCMRIITTN